MFNVADYLKKFARIEGDSLQQREIVSAALKEVCAVENVPFEVKKGVLSVKASPVARSVIFMRKAALLEAIKAKDPKTKITDIR